MGEQLPKRWVSVQVLMLKTQKETASSLSSYQSIWNSAITIDNTLSCKYLKTYMLIKERVKKKTHLKKSAACSILSYKF